MPALVHHLLVAFLVLVVPIWGRIEAAKLQRARTPARKMRSYRRTIIWLWTATILLLLTTPFAQLWRPPSIAVIEAWRTSPGAWSVMAGVAVGLAIGVLVFSSMSIIAARRNPEVRRRMQKSLEQVEFLLPRTSRERAWFAAVALSAGICEEIIFRGFLIRYVDALPIGIGVGASIVIAALIFGLDHGYQGVRGFIVTTVVALVMSVLFFLAGALWLPMALHAAIDLRVLALPIGEGEELAAEAASSE
ncbi:MAG TPA: CPBP family intramembrane glutamic endopeptidase [Gemmatimonadaceae bacterium]|nr:CPBP family intramembrane glutamic endopeptidase [Gemmatimonadaceae bacterium]